MAESTTKVLTSPAPGTVVKPVYEYDDEQKEKIQGLREVRFQSFSRPPCYFTHAHPFHSVRLLTSPP
jgi:hypothetical protein